MALLIKDEDIEALAPMAEVVEAMDIAFADHARGSAPFYPRRIGLRSRSPERPVGYHMATQIGGSAALNVMGVRLMSNLTSRVRRGEPRGPGGHNGRNWGIVTLFDMTTSELLAVLPQFTISGLRVGATSGVGAKYLAREDADTAGIFGTSKIARASLEGIATVRQLKRVKVFSPNPAHRADFVAEMSKRIGVEILAVDEPRKVVEDVGIISASTGSLKPVFDGNWLVPGQYVSTTMCNPYPRPQLRPETVERYPDPEPLKGLEIDDTTLMRADLIGTISREMMLYEGQRDILDLIDAGKLGWEKIGDLGDMAAGLAPGRQRPEDLTVYKSSGGIGLQMAAIGAVVIRNAKKRGIGQEISGEWFSSDMSHWHAKGFNPTQ